MDKWADLEPEVTRQCESCLTLEPNHPDPEHR